MAAVWTGYVALGNVSAGVFTEISPAAYTRQPWNFLQPRGGGIVVGGLSATFALVTGASWSFGAIAFYPAITGGSPALVYPLSGVQVIPAGTVYNQVAAATSIDLVDDLTAQGAPLAADQVSYILGIGSANSAEAIAAYTAIFPTVTFADRLQSTRTITAADPLRSQYTGIGVYIRSQVAATTLTMNCVALFGLALAEVDGAAVWGANTLISDSAGVTAGTGVNRTLTGYENDINVTQTGTTVNGYSAGGNGVAQPLKSNAYIVNLLGPGLKWGGGLLTIDGAATYAIAVGTSNVTPGPDYSSQKITLAFYNHAGTRQTATFELQSTGVGTAGNLVLSGTVTVGFYLAAGDMALGSGTFRGGGLDIGGTGYLGTGSANFVGVSGNVSGYGPTIGAVGANTNIDLNLAPKGTGRAAVAGPLAATGGLDIGGTGYLGTGSANFVGVSGNVSGYGPTIGAVGANTNIDLNLTGKGTGGIIGSRAVTSWGHVAPTSQPARAVTLADVIAVLAATGITA